MKFTFIKQGKTFLEHIAFTRDPSNVLKNSITIRTLLASIVCVSHQLYILCDFHSIALDTRLAVAAFFFISGFSIAHSLNRRTFDFTGLRNFYKARFKRVYIPYLVLILLQTLVFSWIFNSQIIEASKYLFFNVLLLNYKYPFPGEVYNYPVNGSLWSLKWEVLCYILAPILYHFSLKKETNKLMFVLIIVGIVLTSFTSYTHANKPLFLIFIFFIGLRIYFFNSIILAWVTKYPHIIVASLVGYILMMLNGWLGGVYLGVAVVYYLLNHFNLDKWIRTDISYSIYIIHFPLAVLTRNLFSFEPITSPIYTIALFGITIGMSFLYAFIVEKKLTQLLFKSFK
jgi:peptidoglycan/LPS O-acetylase OafA/YrhL